MSHRSRRVYDHRIKEQIIRAGDPELFPELEIPRSTAVSWIRRGLGEIVSLVQADGGEPALRERIAKLQGRVAMLTAVLRLVLALLRVSGFSFELSRVSDAAGKRRLLGAVERARRTMPLSAALRVLRLSSARYHVWARAEEVCTLDDRPSCPRSMPQRLTYGEVEVIGGMVQSTEHRHMSIRGLALHAQRIGKVFAHPATWGKLIRERGWGRPRLRLYPAKPKVGLRTDAPNEAWHLDVTIVRLLDGTKAYVHAVIDNFSRRILAWTVVGRLDPMNTHEVLTRAAGKLTDVQRTNRPLYRAYLLNVTTGVTGRYGAVLFPRKSLPRGTGASTSLRRGGVQSGVHEPSGEGTATTIRTSLTPADYVSRPQPRATGPRRSGLACAAFHQPARSGPNIHGDSDSQGDSKARGVLNSRRITSTHARMTLRELT